MTHQYRKPSNELIQAITYENVDSIHRILMDNLGLLNQNMAVFRDGKKVQRPVWSVAFEKTKGSKAAGILNALFNHDLNIDNSIFAVLSRMDKDAADDLKLMPEFLLQVSSLDAYVPTLKARSKGPSGRSKPSASNRSRSSTAVIHYQYNHLKALLNEAPKAQQQAEELANASEHDNNNQGLSVWGLMSNLGATAQTAVKNITSFKLY